MQSAILEVHIYPTFHIFKRIIVDLWNHLAVYVPVCVFPLSLLDNLSVATQRLCKDVPMAANTHATIEELLKAVFSVWPVSYHGKVGH
jgi:hypothetical protein